MAHSLCRPQSSSKELSSAICPRSSQFRIWFGECTLFASSRTRSASSSRRGSRGRQRPEGLLQPHLFLLPVLLHPCPKVGRDVSVEFIEVSLPISCAERPGVARLMPPLRFGSQAGRSCLSKRRPPQRVRTERLDVISSLKRRWVGDRNPAERSTHLPDGFVFVFGHPANQVGVDRIQVLDPVQ
jgi:hypothetical protein